MDYWNEIGQLKGRTLKTLDQNRAFEVLAVADNAVVLRLHSTNKTRTVRRSEIDPAYRELVARGELARTTIRDKYSERNPAYVAALLAALPNVEHSVSPIVLRYRK